MNNVVYNDKQNWQLNEIVMPEDTNRWEKGIADVVALANYLNTTDIPNLSTAVTNLQNTSANKDLSNLSNLGNQKIIPVGVVFPAPLPSLAGYLLCNGQAVSRTTYSTLYSLIGTSFGSGDGSTTFNVPDYRGCFLRGLGGDSAADMYTKQPQGLPNIAGTLGPSRTLHTANGTTVNTTAPFTKTAISGTNTIGTSGDSSNVYRYGIDLSTANSIYGAANEVRPVNFAINFFIKY